MFHTEGLSGKAHKGPCRITFDATEKSVETFDFEL